jgi:hypothetical protein
MLLLPPSSAGLLCFKDGSLVGAAPLDNFGALDCLLEEAVEGWLRRLRMLRDAPSGEGAAASSGAAGALSSAGSDSEGDSENGEAAGDGWQQPCEVCGRRYPHQHIRSMQATRASNSD